LDSTDKETDPGKPYPGSPTSTSKPEEELHWSASSQRVAQRDVGNKTRIRSVLGQQSYHWPRENVTALFQSRHISGKTKINVYKQHRRYQCFLRCLSCSTAFVKQMFTLRKYVAMFTCKPGSL